MQTNKKQLIQSILLPLAVGSLSGLLSSGAMKDFQNFPKPPLTPPGWLFPIAWTILYLLMGFSAYLIQTANATPERKSNALTLYYYQLIVNFLWPIFFFNFGWFLFAFFWLLLLWVLVALMIWSFKDISKKAALMNIPYLLWLTFALYLNLSIWLRNR